MKRCIIIIITLLLLSMTACAQVSNLLPKGLASNTQATVEQVEADSNTVFAEIQKNIDMVAALKAKVEQARIDGTPLSLDSVIADIKTVSDAYNELSAKHDSIRAGLLKKIANVEQMQSRVDTEISTLKEREADYTTQLRQVSDPSPDIVASRKQALAQAISYVQQQEALWMQFNGIEADIIAELDSVQKTLDSFLSVIDSSAILFSEGLSLLVLQRDLNNALSLFTQDTPRMEQLTQDMTRSWQQLDYLVNQLTGVASIGIK